MPCSWPCSLPFVAHPRSAPSSSLTASPCFDHCPSHSNLHAVLCAQLAGGANALVVYPDYRCAGFPDVVVYLYARQVDLTGRLFWSTVVTCVSISPAAWQGTLFCSIRNRWQLHPPTNVSCGCRALSCHDAAAFGCSLNFCAHIIMRAHVRISSALMRARCTGWRRSTRFRRRRTTAWPRCPISPTQRMRCDTGRTRVGWRWLAILPAVRGHALGMIIGS